MKQGWEIKKLKDISVLIADGDWIESRHQSDAGIRLIQTGNIGNGVFKAKDDKPHYISEETFKELGCTEIFAGDCLVSRLPDPVGRACIVPEVDCRMITAVDCSIIRFRNIILPKLFIYYSQSASYQRNINNNTTGTTRKRISRKNLESIPIPVPPLPEQEKIVSELDCLSGIIEKKRQQLKELDALAQSIFYEMFGNPVDNERGWEVVDFECLCNSMTKGPFGSDIKKSLYVEKSEDAYKVYIQANAIEKDLSIGTYYISKEYFDEKMYRFEVHPYDYIITCDGTLGKFIRLPETIDKGIISASLLRLSIKEEMLLPQYFEFVWSEYMLPLLVKDVRNTALKHLPSASKIGKVRIPLPNIKIQREFAQKIEAIEKQKALIKQSIAEVETLFNARMQEYFE